MQVARLTHHLIHLGDMLLLERDLFPSVFFKPHAPIHDEREQIVVLAKCSALVIQCFTQNLGDVMFMGLDQFADVIRQARLHAHLPWPHGSCPPWLDYASS